jgi:hypothetical protein
MEGIWTGIVNEWNHPRPSRADKLAEKEKKKKKDSDAKLPALEEQKKEQHTTDRTRRISMSSELPDANILQRMREILIESDISGDTYIRTSGFA